MIGEQENREYLGATSSLDKRNTSHTRRGLPGLSHPRRPPKQIGGNGRQKIVSGIGAFTCRGGNHGGAAARRKSLRSQTPPGPAAGVCLWGGFGAETTPSRGGRRLSGIARRRRAPGL